MDMHRSETTVTMMLSVATLVWMLFLNVSTVDTSFMDIFIKRPIFYEMLQVVLLLKKCHLSAYENC